MRRQETFVCDICGRAFFTEDACLKHERECGAAKVKCVRVSLTDKDSEAKFAFGLQFNCSGEKSNLGVICVHPCGLGFLMDTYVQESLVHQAVESLAAKAEKLILEREERLLHLRKSLTGAKEDVKRELDRYQLRDSE